MQIIIKPSRSEWPQILQRPAFDSKSLENTVDSILQDVRKNGDAAIKKYTTLFDGIELPTFLVDEPAFDEAEELVSNELKNAIELAKNNITAFHATQREGIQKVETTAGVNCWRKTVAIEKVGLYIPGGTAPLFSTLLMLGIPALLAGCSEIVVCTPCSKNGKINPAILYVAKILGIKKVFAVGGVQAIAAMAYGTESISKVYKIFGPGNQYVTCAKQLITKEGVAIDMPAGPSEVAVYADNTANASFVAADLLSQAEHGVDSQVMLVATDEQMIHAVKIEIEKQLQQLSRKGIAAKALQNSKLILMNNSSEAFELLNAYAPEHLIVAANNAMELSEKVINAGSVFIGHYSPESVGDYASGTNHTLPTNGYAKAYSGVSMDSFVKKITFQQLTPNGLQNIGPAVETMAATEGLDAHRNAVTIRLKTL